MIDLLYKKQAVRCECTCDFEIKKHKLGLFSLRLQGEKITFKSLLVRLSFCILTFGKSYIYYAMDGEKIIHTSFLIPKCVKFAFMKKSDYEIGPCFTVSEYRGKKIYPSVLKRILSDVVENGGGICYMLVSPTNEASIHGIENAGFELAGQTLRTCILKIYRSIDNDN